MATLFQTTTILCLDPCHSLLITACHVFLPATPSSGPRCNQYHLSECNSLIQARPMRVQQPPNWHDCPGMGCNLSYWIIISSVTQSCPTLCGPMNRSMPGLPVHHQLLESTQPMSIESVMPSNHLILCRSLLLLPPVLASIRVFSNESALHIRWPKEFQLQHQSFQWTSRNDLL